MFRLPITLFLPMVCVALALNAQAQEILSPPTIGALARSQQTIDPEVSAFTVVIESAVEDACLPDVEQLRMLAESELIKLGLRVNTNDASTRQYVVFTFTPSGRRVSGNQSIPPSCMLGFEYDLTLTTLEMGFLHTVQLLSSPVNQGVFYLDNPDSQQRSEELLLSVVRAFHAITVKGELKGPDTHSIN